MFVRLFHLRHLSLDGVGFFALAFLHQTTNLGCHLLGFRQVLVQQLLGFAAFLVNGQDLVDGLFGSLKVFLLKSANNAVGLFCNEL